MTCRDNGWIMSNSEVVVNEREQANALVEHGLSRVRNISPAKRASRKLRSTSAMPFPCSSP